MPISLIAVASVNALITRNEEPGTGFASQADFDWFRQKLKDSDLVLLGGATYRAARESIRENARTGPPRWVFSRNIAQHEDDTIPGAVEFRTLDRDCFLADTTARGFTDIALVGGPALSTWFLDQGLVDELYLTVEPLIFSSGTPLVTSGRNIDLALESVKRLSDQTLLLHYRLKR